MRKPIRVIGTIDYPDAGDDRYADVALLTDEGETYLLDTESFESDVFEWIDLEVQVTGWKYFKFGRFFLKPRKIEELGRAFDLDALENTDAGEFEYA